MIKINIAGEERLITSNIDRQWINQQIINRRNAGQNVCVRVTIHEGGLEMSLATPTCASSGGRRPSGAEEGVLSLWEKRGLSKEDFTSDNVVIFLEGLQRLF